MLARNDPSHDIQSQSGDAAAHRSALTTEHEKAWFRLARGGAEPGKIPRQVAACEALF
jgi:hypothetical protein